ncbi:subtilisin-like protein, partial [Mycena filopes]
MAFSKLLAFLFIFAVQSVVGRPVLHESRSLPPSGFVSQGAALASEVLTLRVALAANNLSGLKSKLASVSTPGSSEFRQWLTKDEVKSFVQPSAATIGTFNMWASANGLNSTIISPNGDWVEIAVPVSQANTLFAANFEVFTHPDIPNGLTRTLSVSLPSELVGHVDVIHPTVDFVVPDTRLPLPTSSAAVRKRDVPASCDTANDSGVITPSCLQELYGIPSAPATHSKTGNALMVTGYTRVYVNEADLATFLTTYRPDIPSNTTFPLLTLDGGVNPQESDGPTEGNLDIQYTTGIATGVPIQFLSVGGEDTTPAFITALLDTTIFMDGMDDPPAVVTTSYATTETNVGSSMATKICDGYAALGARGVSVVFASGDGGVRGAHGSGCTNNTFLATFPASCPYVTSVGSTLGLAPETAANFSGGMFSSYFPAPSYQLPHVAAFLDTLPSDFPGVFNPAFSATTGWDAL